jgi:uncharacterized protein (TIGR00369 family)
MEDPIVQDLPTSPHCFVCGEHNPAGLNARFHVANGFVKMPLTAGDRHCGYPNVVHGGVLAAALDECMGWAAARSIHRMCVTGELTVRYLKPVAPGPGFTVHAEVVRSSRRLVHTKGWITGPDGERHASAEGRFLPLSEQETLRVDDGLVYRGGEERVFDVLRPAGEGTKAE